MIEQFFKKGLCLSWTPPLNVDPPVRDGVFHHRTRHSAPMTFDGLSANPASWDHSFQHTAPSAQGMAKGVPISHKWLDYRLGDTARCHRGSHDVLTGFMSGCLIVTWTDNAGGQWVGHIGTVSTEAPTGPTNVRVKTYARNNLPANATGFSPANSWTQPELMQLAAEARKDMAIGNVNGMPQILALVTTNGAYFSIAVMSHQNGKYVVLGIKPGIALSNAQLVTALS